jgi:hypothetical protein
MQGGYGGPPGYGGGGGAPPGYGAPPAGYGPPPAGYGAPPAAQAATGGAGFDFDQMHNATISSMGKSTRLWGIISIIMGVVLLLVTIGLGAFLAMAPSSADAKQMATMGAAIGSVAAMSLVNLATGWFYISSGNAFTQVTTTQGNDVPLLMRALGTLSRAFMIEAIATAIGFVIGLVVGILARVT